MTNTELVTIKNNVLNSYCILQRDIPDIEDINAILQLEEDLDLKTYTLGELWCMNRSSVKKILRELEDEALEVDHLYSEINHKDELTFKSVIDFMASAYTL